MGKDSNQLPLHISLIVIIGVFAAASFGKIEQLWGLNFLKFFGSAPVFFLVPLVVIAALPFVSSKILRGLSFLSYSEGSKKTGFIIGGLIAGVAVMILGFLYPTATNLLGDGNLRLNQIAEGRFFLNTEFLDYLIHAVIYSQIIQPALLEMSYSYSITSAICGFFFVFGVFRLGWYLAPGQLWVAFLSMVSSGILVLFFGYVESYSIIAALLPYIFLSGLKVTDGKSGKGTYLALCILAVLVHVVALVIFLPSMLLMFIPTRDNARGRGKTITAALVAAMLFAVVVAYIGRYAGIDAYDRYLMPLFSRPEYLQGIFTVTHFANIFNWLFLSALPVLLLVPYLVWRGGVPDFWMNRRMLYVLWIVIPCLFFIFFFTPQLGGPADWDLFALPAFMMIPALLTVYLADGRRRLPFHIVPVILLSFILTLSFALINSNAAFSVDRYTEILEVSKFKNLTKQYRLLASTVGNRPEVRGRQLEFLNRAWSQPPYTRTDSVDVLSDLGEIYMEQGDRERAYQYISQALSVDSLSLNSYNAMVRYLRRYGTAVEMHQLALVIENVFADSAQGLVAAGAVYQQVGDSENGGRCFQRAYELDDDDYYILLNYGRYLLYQGEFSKSAELLSKAVSVNPASFRANYFAAQACFNAGDKSGAKRFFDRAKRLQQSKDEARLIEELQAQLN